AADVINAVADLAKVAGGRQGASIPADDERLQRLSETLSELPPHPPMTLVDFAEIHVYEPHVTPECRMEWTEIAHLRFNRDYLGAKAICREYAPKTTAQQQQPPPAGGLTGGSLPGTSDDVAKVAVAGVFGLPLNTPAITAVPGQFQGGAPAPAAAV